MSRHDWPITIDETFGCWEWTGKLDDAGYPIVWRGGHPVKAYLIVYASEVGPVPDGMTLEHRCRRRACVFPNHLKPVTQGENLFRRRWDVRVRRPICDANHDALYAVVTPEGGRLCRLCDKGGE